MCYSQTIVSRRIKRLTVRLRRVATCHETDNADMPASCVRAVASPDSHLPNGYDGIEMLEKKAFALNVAARGPQWRDDRRAHRARRLSDSESERFAHYDGKIFCLSNARKRSRFRSCCEIS